MSLVTLAVSAPLIFNPLHQPLWCVAGLSLLVYVASMYMIPRVSPALIKVGLFGKDRLKPEQDQKVPESLGTVVGVIYIFAVLFFTPFTLAVDGLVAFLSGILSIQSMVMLGFADDLFDLRWRHKFFLPAISSIPLLIVYYLEHGVTRIVLPSFLNLGESVDLHWFYYVYMASLAIFATNCINIYAGVNGLEVGQTIVVVSSVIINDLLYVFHDRFIGPLQPATIRAHTLSLFFAVPLLSCSVALIRFNWYPAKVFVGDSYCYFAGMVLAVAGITGHFSKTLLSFILPQIVNFIYSAPQILRVVPCPRHRMPSIDPNTGLLLPSRANVTSLAPWKLSVLRLLKACKCLEIYETKEKGKIVKLEISNMTIITLVLVHKGPITEEQLTRALLRIQIVSCALALIARHLIAKLVFDSDNI